MIRLVGEWMDGILRRALPKRVHRFHLIAILFLSLMNMGALVQCDPEIITPREGDSFTNRIDLLHFKVDYDNPDVLKWEIYLNNQTKLDVMGKHEEFYLGDVIANGVNVMDISPEHVNPELWIGGEMIAEPFLGPGRHRVVVYDSTNSAKRDEHYFVVNSFCNTNPICEENPNYDAPYFDWSCNEPYCNSETDRCEGIQLPNGADCKYVSPQTNCRTNFRCIDGTCVSDQVSCDQGEVCDERWGCGAYDVPDCNDQIDCTHDYYQDFDCIHDPVDERCHAMEGEGYRCDAQAGCIEVGCSNNEDCAASAVCRKAFCNMHTWQCEERVARDGTFCSNEKRGLTTWNECVEGVCVPVYDICDDGIECTEDNEINGECIHIPVDSICKETDKSAVCFKGFGCHENPCFKYSGDLADECKAIFAEALIKERAFDAAIAKWRENEEANPGSNVTNGTPQTELSSVLRKFNEIRNWNDRLQFAETQPLLCDPDIKICDYRISEEHLSSEYVKRFRENTSLSASHCNCINRDLVTWIYSVNNGSECIMDGCEAVIHDAIITLGRAKMTIRAADRQSNIIFTQIGSFNRIINKGYFRVEGKKKRILIKPSENARENVLIENLPSSVFHSFAFSSTQAEGRVEYGINRSNFKDLTFLASPQGSVQIVNFNAGNQSKQILNLSIYLSHLQYATTNLEYEGNLRNEQLSEAFHLMGNEIKGHSPEQENRRTNGIAIGYSKLQTKNAETLIDLNGIRQDECLDDINDSNAESNDNNAPNHYKHMCLQGREFECFPTFQTKSKIRIYDNNFENIITPILIKHVSYKLTNSISRENLLPREKNVVLDIRNNHFTNFGKDYQGEDISLMQTPQCFYIGETFFDDSQKQQQCNEYGHGIEIICAKFDGTIRIENNVFQGFNNIPLMHGEIETVTDDNGNSSLANTISYYVEEGTSAISMNHVRHGKEEKEGIYIVDNHIPKNNHGFRAVKILDFGPVADEADLTASQQLLESRAPIRPSLTCRAHIFNTLPSDWSSSEEYAEMRNKWVSPKALHVGYRGVEIIQPSIRDKDSSLWNCNEEIVTLHHLNIIEEGFRIPLEKMEEACCSWEKDTEDSKLCSDYLGDNLTTAYRNTPEDLKQHFYTFLQEGINSSWDNSKMINLLNPRCPNDNCNYHIYRNLLIGGEENITVHGLSTNLKINRNCLIGPQLVNAETFCMDSSSPYDPPKINISPQHNSYKSIFLRWEPLEHFENPTWRFKNEVDKYLYSHNDNPEPCDWDTVFNLENSDRNPRFFIGGKRCFDKNDHHLDSEGYEPLCAEAAMPTCNSNNKPSYKFRTLNGVCRNFEKPCNDGNSETICQQEDQLRDVGNCINGIYGRKQTKDYPWWKWDEPHLVHVLDTEHNCLPEETEDIPNICENHDPECDRQKYYCATENQIDSLTENIHRSGPKGGISIRSTGTDVDQLEKSIDDGGDGAIYSGCTYTSIDSAMTVVYGNEWLDANMKCQAMRAFNNYIFDDYNLPQHMFCNISNFWQHDTLKSCEKKENEPNSGDFPDSRNETYLMDYGHSYAWPANIDDIGGLDHGRRNAQVQDQTIKCARDYHVRTCDQPETRDEHLANHTYSDRMHLTVCEEVCPSAYVPQKWPEWECERRENNDGSYPYCSSDTFHNEFDCPKHTEWGDFAGYYYEHRNITNGEELKCYDEYFTIP